MLRELLNSASSLTLEITGFLPPHLPKQNLLKSKTPKVPTVPLPWIRWLLDQYAGAASSKTEHIFQRDKTHNTYITVTWPDTQSNTEPTEQHDSNKQEYQYPSPLPPLQLIRIEDTHTHAYTLDSHAHHIHGSQILAQALSHIHTRTDPLPGHWLKPWVSPEADLLPLARQSSLKQVH